MSPERTGEDEAIAGRGVAPPGEAAPRQLAALLRIEDLLLEQTALLRRLTTGQEGGTAPKGKTARSG